MLVLPVPIYPMDPRLFRYGDVNLTRVGDHFAVDAPTAVDQPVIGGAAVETGRAAGELDGLDLGASSNHALPAAKIHCSPRPVSATAFFNTIDPERPFIRC